MSDWCEHDWEWVRRDETAHAWVCRECGIYALHREPHDTEGTA